MELKNVCKSFGENDVLRDVSLVIPKGSRVLISAPSGRGKTTLLRIMMGLEKPDSGEIINRPRSQAAVFQEDRLPDAFTPVNCVKMTAAHGVTKNIIREHLRSVGLEGHCDKPVSQLSGGMRRRVATVRAVLSGAETVYFDEPFTGLDEDTIKHAGNAFAVGMGNMEGTCGALVGAGIVLGLATKDKARSMKGMRQIMERFQQRNGATQCRLLKGAGGGKVLRECAMCVADASEFLEELLAQEGK